MLLEMYKVKAFISLKIYLGLKFFKFKRRQFISRPMALDTHIRNRLGYASLKFLFACFFQAGYLR